MVLDKNKGNHTTTTTTTSCSCSSDGGGARSQSLTIRTNSILLNAESVLENETHKLHWDFEIQTDHQVAARQPDIIIINKKEITYSIVDFAVPADHRVNTKNVKKGNCGT